MNDMHVLKTKIPLLGTEPQILKPIAQALY